jgi:hypothetical protein
MSEPATTTPSPGSQSSPADLGTIIVGQAKRDLEDWVVRAQYEIAEKAEERLWKSLKSKALIFTVAFLVLGFLGSPMLLDLIASKIKTDIEQDATTLRQRVVSELADMAVQTAGLKSQADTAKNELAQLDQYAQEFNKLEPQYSALKAQVDADAGRVSDLEKELKLRTDQAANASRDLKVVTTQVDQMKTTLTGTQVLATGAQFGIASLSTGLLSSNLGGPAIFSGPSTFSTSLTLSGFNFGTTKGHVYLYVLGLGTNSTAQLGTLGSNSALANPTLANTILSNPSLSESIEIGSDSITGWENSSVTLNLTPKVMEKAHQAATQAGLTGLVNFQFKIQTSSGEQSNWYSILGNL